jgi:hypothetical protein
MWVVVVSAVVCLLAILIGKAAVDWRLRHLDEALQKQVLEAPVHAGQPRHYPLPNELVSALVHPSDFRVYHRAANIPDLVHSAFTRAADEKSFSMADPNG